jgi:hypothetical protein
MPLHRAKVIRTLKRAKACAPLANQDMIREPGGAIYFLQAQKIMIGFTGKQFDFFSTNR